MRPIRPNSFVVAGCGLILMASAPAQAQGGAQPATDTVNDPVRDMVVAARSREVQGDDQGADAVRRSPPGHRPQSRGGRLDRGAAQELWLHEHASASRTPSAAPPPRRGGGPAGGRGGAGGGRGGECEASGGGRMRGIRATHRREHGFSEAAGPQASRARHASRPSTGERQEVYCTKVGTTHPDEMYIVGGHMDGIGWGEAANDDGSGTALVMELARVFSSPDVQTDRSIRFILWNNEESGLERRAGLRRPAAGAAG